MFKTIRTAALSAVIGLGALAAAPATAQADSFYFGISPNGPSFGFHSDSSRRWDRGGWHHNRRHWHRSGCSVRDALNKADRMGINRAHVRRSNRNVIRVAGRKRGHHVAVVFANAPHCPVIRWG
ncbi:MAG: hypothetical protein JJ913_10215 [Rhizobiaceae bacterium]|nr:hypothetical protein [Rhizobiaceae bacterium]